ncbi:MAG: hypothetical protein SOY86_10405 [Romboutsia timonensis]|nr:hypothetical protein [Romboutsia timonensis]
MILLFGFSNPLSTTSVHPLNSGSSESVLHTCTPLSELVAIYIYDY